MKHIALLVGLLSLFALNNCAPVAVGAAATTGVAAAQERTVGRAIDDSTIHSKILGTFSQKDVNDLLTNVNVEVTEGAVLLTGAVNKPETIIEAVKICWQVEGVKEVINEIQVNDRKSLKDYAKDTWITTQVKGRLIAEKNLRSVNYTVETINSVVYLMGIAQSQEELDKATYIASRVKGVGQVVSHVRLKTDPRRQ